MDSQTHARIAPSGRPARILLIGDGAPARIVARYLADLGAGAHFGSDEVGGGRLLELSGEHSHLVNVNSLHIYTPEELAAFPAGALNMHPAPLPHYAGLYCHYWAIKNGEKEWAATIHDMEPGLDTGDIVAQARFPLDDRDTPQSVYAKSMSAGAKLMTEVIDQLLAGQPLPRTPQDLSKRKLYTRKMAKEAGFI